MLVRTAAIGAIATLLTSTAGAAEAADMGVTLHNVVARVEVIPENRSDVQVTIAQGRKALPAMTVRRDGGRVYVDGGLGDRIKGCGSMHVGFSFHREGHDPDRNARAFVSGYGNVGPDDMPMITVRVPMDARIDASGAVFGRIGPSTSLDFANAGCGDWSIADVKGDLGVSINGSGDVRAAHAGNLRAAISGSGDLTLARVEGAAIVRTSGSADVKAESVGSLEASIAGSSDIRVGQVTGGAIRTHISGSGDVTIESGRASDVQVAVAGSGDFRFGGDAGAVSASTAGSGDITVAHASGPVSQSKAGSGDIHIGR